MVFYSVFFMKNVRVDAVIEDVVLKFNFVMLIVIALIGFATLVSAEVRTFVIT